MNNAETTAPDVAVPAEVLPTQPTDEKPAGVVDTPTTTDPAEPAPPSPPLKPATLKEKIGLALYLLVWVALLLPSIWSKIDQLNASAVAEVSVGWEMSPGVTLNPGPAAFRYDATQKKLVHYGAITAERKLELRALFAPEPPVPVSSKATDSATKPSPQTNPSHKPPETGSSTSAGATAENGPAAIARMEMLRRSYSEAIDNLAYLGTVRQGELISLLLVLGGLGGALGAILRSLVDFTGHASYTQRLDLSRWWPLYFTRPLVGGILGFVLIILLKAKLLAGGSVESSNSDSFWWLGVAILGGFSTVDVTLRLRMAAKAMFGEGGKKE